MLAWQWPCPGLCATSLMKTQPLNNSTDLSLVRKLAIDLTFLNSVSLSFPSEFFLLWKEVSLVYFSFWLLFMNKFLWLMIFFRCISESKICSANYWGFFFFFFLIKISYFLSFFLNFGHATPRPHWWKHRILTASSVQFSRSVLSDSLQPHGLQHARLPCISPT